MKQPFTEWLDGQIAKHLSKQNLRKVEPTASDLEKLLREAGLKGRLEELRKLPEACNYNSERHPHFCQYHQRIAELEKARAILEEKR